MKPNEEAARVVIAVSKATGATPVEILGRRKFYDYSRAKFMVAILLKEALPRLSSARLGMLLDCDHSTIRHRLKRAGEMLSSEEEFRSEYEQAKAQLLRPCQTTK